MKPFAGFHFSGGVKQSLQGMVFPSMNTSRYTIGELAKAAAVTPRTIRFYTAEGLLPPPLSEGRYALYTDAHRTRLHLIQRLKSAFLPLHAIRTHIEGLTEGQIRQLIGDVSAGSDTKEQEHLPAIRLKTTEPHLGQSSLDYLAQILAVTGQGAAGESAIRGEEPKKRALLVSPVFQPQADIETVREDAPALQQTGPEVWERIRLSARLELHVRAPLTTEDRHKIEQIAACAKALYPENA